MYWIYLALFILAVLTPEIIARGTLFLREEDVESLLILCFGLLGFALYLAKEKAFLRVFQEKLHLQRRTHLITRDLSDSYSYIGGMNRKFDIVKELIFHLPQDMAEVFAKREPETYQPIIQTVKLLAKATAVSLRFVNMRTKDIEKAVENDPEGIFSAFDAKTLLASKKTFWEEKGCVVVRSPRQAKNMTVYIIFPKATNRIDDIEVFKILASQALLLFCVDRFGAAERNSKLVSDQR